MNKTKTELMKCIAFARYSHDDIAQNLANEIIKLLDNYLIVNKDDLYNFLNCFSCSDVDDEHTKIVNISITLKTFIDKKVNVPDTVIKRYTFDNFCHLLENLNEKLPEKKIKRKSDLSSEEKKMIKLLRKEFRITDLSELEEWIADYRLEQARQMNDALDKYYKGM